MASWALQIDTIETEALGRFRTFLNFYTDAAGLELQAIAPDGEQIVVRVAGTRAAADGLRNRLSEIYPAARVWLEPQEN